MPRTASSTSRTGCFCADVLGALFAQAAFVAAVIPVELLFFLAAGQLDLRRVDDDDVIAGVDVRRVDRLVLALQQAGRLGRDAAQDLALGVDDVPLPLHTAGSGNKRTHGDPFRPSLKLRADTPQRGAGGQPLSKDGKPKGYRRLAELSRRRTDTVRAKSGAGPDSSVADTGRDRRNRSRFVPEICHASAARSTDPDFAQFCRN